MFFFLCLVLLLAFRNGPRVEADVRLVNGFDACSGRVELLHNGTWGTVCDDNWYVPVAALVCKELGCGDIIDEKSYGYFGEGSGPIWMDEIDCVGNESSLVDCGFAGWGITNCEHDEDAGVICQGLVRLVNGMDSCSGRVELLHDGQWGTVCDNDWDILDAAVVCREVGCADAIEAKTGAYFGEGSGQIWMDAAQCFGIESSVESCNSTKWGIQSCTHSKDAGVICNPPIRLINGSDSCSGRVEVLHDGQWGTVCTDSWDSTDAAVACKEFGCPTGAELTRNSYGPGEGIIWMDEVECSGSELSLNGCPLLGWGRHDCDHSYDAGVICRDVRLVNGSDLCSGRVEVLHNDQWGTVCDAGWDLTDASVMCYNMGCGTPIAAPTGAYFGQGSGSVWLDSVSCSGIETTLKDCPSKAIGTSTCSHGQDAGVVCNPPVRLVNGENSCSGRVEVLHDGVWGTVCTDYWGTKDATVACKELGCPTGAEAKSYSYFGPGVGALWMDNVHCKGSEPTLRECRFNGWGINNCDHSYDAGVICRDVRLINGSNLCSGRVEVLYNDEWGTVCDAGWDLTDAAVVCNSMDCGTPVAVMTAAYFGQGSGPVWLDDLSCSGYELSVKDCLSIPLGTSTCSHGRDAGVVCRDIRLVNGMGPCDGKVEVLYDDHWGGVCHTGFDVKAASVVCKELGCENTGEPLSYMGPFDGPIWMGNLACAGNELTLRDCSFTGWGVSSCVNDLHAGVICNKIMRQGVVRITVTADAGVDVSNPDIIKKLLDKISKVVKGQGDYLTNWKTQPNGNVFQEIPTLQVVTECNKDQ